MEVVAVKERADLQDWFEMVGKGRGLKTLVLEVHREGLAAADAVEALATLFPDQQTHPTEDGTLQRLVGEEEFVVDSLDRRFWSFHTPDASGSARAILDRAVSSSRHLDRMWLSWEHLYNIQSDADSPSRASFKASQVATGKQAAVSFNGMGQEEHAILRQFFDYSYSVAYDNVSFEIYDPDYGRFREKLTGDGTFITTGDTFHGHESFVGDVVGRYRQLIEGVEGNAMRWESSEAGVRPLGKPIFIEFERPFPDRGRLYQDMFSCRMPFRLWAAASPDRASVSDGEVISAEAVDLHVGQRLTMELGNDWVRVYVREGNCGNSVARLIANLQKYANSPLRLADPDLQATLDQMLSYPEAPQGALALA